MITKLLTDKEVRDDIRDKFEVIMAVVVLTGFLYKKYQNRRDGYIDITSFGQEK